MNLLSHYEIEQESVIRKFSFLNEYWISTFSVSKKYLNYLIKEIQVKLEPNMLIKNNLLSMTNYGQPWVGFQIAL